MGRGKKTRTGLEDREQKNAGHQDYMFTTHLDFRMQPEMMQITGMLSCLSWAEEQEVPEESYKTTASQNLIEMAAKVVKFTSSPENQTLSTSTMDGTDLHHSESQLARQLLRAKEWTMANTSYWEDTTVFFFLIVRNMLWLVHFCLISYFFLHRIQS